MDKEFSASEIENYVRSNLDVLWDLPHRGDIVCVCPNCGEDDGKFAVNPAKGVMNCWHATCGYKGYWKKLWKFFGEPNSDYQISYTVGKTKVDHKITLDPRMYYDIWGDSFVPWNDLAGSPTRLSIENFFRERYIDLKLPPFLEVRVSTKKIPQEIKEVYGNLEGYIGFPYRPMEGTKYDYFQYRATPMKLSMVTPEIAKNIKWKFPKLCGSLDKRNYLYSVSDSWGMVILTESLLDAIRCGIYGKSLGGSSISEMQLKILQTQRPKFIIVLLDGDKPGHIATFGGRVQTSNGDWVDREGIAPLLQTYTRSQVLVPPKEWFDTGKDPDQLDNSTLDALLESCKEHSRYL